jgi:hypothetical protein
VTIFRGSPFYEGYITKTTKPMGVIGFAVFVIYPSKKHLPEDGHTR